MRRTSLLVIGVLAALALGATQASAASVTDQWLVEGETFSELGIEEEEVEVTGGSLAIAIPSLKITIECATVEGTGKVKSGGTGELSLSLSKCKTIGSKACEVTKPIVIKEKSMLIRAGGSYYEEFSPQEAALGTAYFGEECALGEEVPIKGSVAGEAPLGGEVESTLNFSQAITEAVNESLGEEKESTLELSIVKHTAFFSGKLKTVLSGAHSGGEWVLAPRTTLCKMAPVGRNQCAEGQLWEAGTTIWLQQVVEMRFKIGLAEFNCISSVLEGTTSVEEGNPLTGTLTTVAFTGCSECSVEPLSASYPVEFYTRGAGNGAMFIMRPRFKFICPGGNCVYSDTDVVLRLIAGGAQAGAISETQEMNKEAMGSAAGCAAKAKWEGVTNPVPQIFYHFESPMPMWVTG
jgi:hypothetical protein